MVGWSYILELQNTSTVQDLVESVNPLSTAI